MCSRMVTPVETSEDMSPANKKRYLIQFDTEILEHVLDDSEIVSEVALLLGYRFRLSKGNRVIQSISDV